MQRKIQQKEYLPVGLQQQKNALYIEARYFAIERLNQQGIVFCDSTVPSLTADVEPTVTFLDFGGFYKNKKQLQGLYLPITIFSVGF